MYVKRGGRWVFALNAEQRNDLLKEAAADVAHALATFNPDDDSRKNFLVNAATNWYEVRSEFEAARVVRLVEKRLKDEFKEEES
jgi:hypothetical protein